jgi:hypothetical protein
MIVFDSTLLDPHGPSTPIPTAIQGDGGGPYIDGAQGIACSVDPGTASTGFPHAGHLHVQPASRGTRYFLAPGQTAVNVYSVGSYPTLQIKEPGYFEIYDMAVIPVGQTVRRVVRLGAASTGEFRGDSTSTEPAFVGTSSAWVTRLSTCSWRAVWYPWAPLEQGENAYAPNYPTVPRVMALYTPAQNKVPTPIRLADFSMPLSATVTLIGGVVPGCN